MAIIRSFGTVQSLAAPTPSWSNPSYASGSSAFNSSYAMLYRTQPNVRVCVDFLARNVAQLGVQAFRRVSDTDRQRLADHEVIQWLSRPNPATTRYRLFESLMQDLGIYFNAFWLKVRAEQAIGLVRLPPEQMEVIGGIFPSGYRWTMTNGETRDFAPSEIVSFGGYDPCNPLTGLSPLETLRRLLSEGQAASDYRQYFWRNAARQEGIIERPKDAPKWNETQRKVFRESWQSAHSGSANSGKTAVLEDGMTWKERSFSAKDSQFVDASKLAREICAAAYHIPQPFVGILDHATFSNVKEQHKHLYQDCLGTWTEMIVEELERQLLPEAMDDDKVYLEFNIAEKLKGSFEEQAAALQTLVGGPVMTQNEGRARLNLSSIDDPSADELIKQQNISGKPATDLPADGVPGDDAAALAILHVTKARQQARLSKLPAQKRRAAFNLDRWNRELTADLLSAGMPLDRARVIAEQANTDTLRELTGRVQ